MASKPLLPLPCSVSLASSLIFSAPPFCHLLILVPLVKLFELSLLKVTSLVSESHAQHMGVRLASAWLLFGSSSSFLLLPGVLGCRAAASPCARAGARLSNARGRLCQLSSYIHHLNSRAAGTGLAGEQSCSAWPPSVSFVGLQGPSQQHSNLPGSLVQIPG